MLVKTAELGLEPRQDPPKGSVLPLHHSAKSPVLPLHQRVIGAGSRIRTDDRLITNQVLYQLSYTGAIQ